MVPSRNIFVYHFRQLDVKCLTTHFFTIEASLDAKLHQLNKISVNALPLPLAYQTFFLNTWKGTG